MYALCRRVQSAELDTDPTIWLQWLSSLFVVSLCNVAGLRVFQTFWQVSSIQGQLRLHPILALLDRSVREVFHCCQLGDSI